MTEPYPGQSGYPPQEPPAGYDVPQPPAAGYPPGYPGYYYPPQRRTNGLAIAALVVSCASLVTCPLLGGVGAVLGHVARRQIRETGEEGDGLALAGIIIGWILVALSLLTITGYVVFIVWMVNNGATMDPAHVD
jgi:hypothetical protein